MKEQQYNNKLNDGYLLTYLVTNQPNLFKKLVKYEELQQYARILYIFTEFKFVYANLIKKITGYRYNHILNILRKLEADEIIIKIGNEGAAKKFIDKIAMMESLSPYHTAKIKLYIINPAIEKVINLFEWDKKIDNAILVRVNEIKNKLKEAEEKIIEEKMREKLLADKIEMERKAKERMRDIRLQAKRILAGYHRKAREMLAGEDYKLWFIFRDKHLLPAIEASIRTGKDLKEMMEIRGIDKEIIDALYNKEYERIVEWIKQKRKEEEQKKRERARGIR